LWRNEAKKRAGEEGACVDVKKFAKAGTFTTRTTLRREGENTIER